MSPEQARRVAALELDGVGFMKENRRFYPNKELAAHLLGYVGIDNDGLSGIEATYDTLIKGRPGTVLIQTDARRHAFSRIERPPTTGATLELTIDQYLQHIAERELRAGVEVSRRRRRHGGRHGSVDRRDPRAGQLADVQPERLPRRSTRTQRRNRAIQDLYEPGSTFKIVTAGAALEEKVVDADDDRSTSAPGSIRFGSRVIHDDHDYGVLSFTDVIVKSSNVGAIKVGLRLGPERLGDYVKRFGFGRPTSPDFRGESPGIVWDPSKLTDSALASVSMGYQVGVTPLQMAAAVSSVANGGELVQPRVVRAVIRDGKRAAGAAQGRRPHDQRRHRGGADRRSWKRSSSAAPASSAQIAGYTVAGKTGTAQKVVNGRYSHIRLQRVVRRLRAVAQAGLHDRRRRRLAARQVPPTAASVAAPIFQRIAEAALRHYGVPPTINAPPPVLVARRERDAASSRRPDRPRRRRS